MFQFGRFPAYDYLFIIHYLSIPLGGLPHSDSCGSTLICSSPQLFAACRVLLRLPVPRHSPCALSSLNFMSSQIFYSFKVFTLFLCVSTVLVVVFYPDSTVNHFCSPVFVICAYSLCFLKNSICFLKSFVLFSFQGTLLPRLFRTLGWLKWARTTDLALIRRAL